VDNPCAWESLHATQSQGLHCGAAVTKWEWRAEHDGECIADTEQAKEADQSYVTDEQYDFGM